MFGRGHTSFQAVVPVQMIGITGFVSHTVSCYLLFYHCTVLLNVQMYIEICLWREDGKIKILRYSFYPVDQIEFVYNCSMAPSLFVHQDFEFVHWPKCSIMLSI
jgi:hypothetical protein